MANREWHPVHCTVLRTVRLDSLTLGSLALCVNPAYRISALFSRISRLISKYGNIWRFKCHCPMDICHILYLKWNFDRGSWWSSFFMYLYSTTVQYYSMKSFFSEIVPTDSFSFISIFKKIMPRKCLEREHPRPFNMIACVISEGDLTSRFRIVKVLTSVAESAMHSAP